MVFNPLFLQNAPGVENLHPEKVNKLSGSGYLFSDIINVFMNTEETDSLTKLTQEFLGSAQLKESNGTPVILNLLGETTVSLNGISKNLKLKIEDFLPAGLKKSLIKIEGENNKNVVEKSLTADQKQLAQILESISQLLGIGNTEIKNDSENTAVNLSETVGLLEESDGVFLIVETADKIFNINISKLIDENGIGTNPENKNGGSENLYKVKFTLINEKTLYNNSANNTLASNSVQNNTQLSFLHINSELAAENTNASAAKLKVFTYQNAGNENVLVESSKNKLKLVEAASGTQNKNTAKETEVNVGGKESASISATAEKQKTASVSVKESEKENVLNGKAGKTENQKLTGTDRNEKTYGIQNDALKSQTKELLSSLPKTELKEYVEHKTDVKPEAQKPFEKTSKEKIDENDQREFDTKAFEKNISDGKDNEQFNIKVSKAVKNITTIKAENNQQPNSEKTVKENPEAKTNSADEKVKIVQTAESNEKNFSQNENSSKQTNDNKNFAFDPKIDTVGSKEKFTLDAPVPNSNTERIVKIAEMMKEISKFIEKQDKSTLTIKISLENLGKLKITLDIVEQNVKANIHVENEAVKTIIEKNIAELQNQMSKSGIQLTSVNVSLSENDQKNAKQFTGKKKTSSFESDDKNIDENEEEKIKMMGYNTVEYLA